MRKSAGGWATLNYVGSFWNFLGGRVPGGWQAGSEALAVVFDLGGAAPFGFKGAGFDSS